MWAYKYLILFCTLTTLGGEISSGNKCHSQSRFHAAAEPGQRGNLIPLSWEDSICSGLTTHTTIRVSPAPLWTVCRWQDKDWVCDSLSARVDRSASHPLTLGVRLVTYSTQLSLPPGTDILSFCVIARLLIHVLFVCLFCSKEFTVINKPWWWPRAGPMLFVICWALGFCSISDGQKISISSLTNWQYVPGLGVGSSHCFSSFQIMCWTPHLKPCSSGAANTFLCHPAH